MQTSPQHLARAPAVRDKRRVTCLIVSIRNPEKTPHERRFGEPFKGPTIPFWSNVSTSFVFTERSVEDYQFDKKVLLGVFLGYELIAGGIWKLDILIADLEDMQTLDASDIYLRKDVLIRQKDVELVFPTADGTAESSGRTTNSENSKTGTDREE